MTIFTATINQMALLFLYILIGYVVSKLKVVSDNSAEVLSKLENNVFIPALVIGTFMNNFTAERLTGAWQYFIGGFVLLIPTLPLGIMTAKAMTKDHYIRSIYTYGLVFANFGFMGNAVVAALFPDVFMEYLIFVIPLWILIYMWGVPVLLIPSDGEKKNLTDRLKSFANPMFIGMLIGMVLGLVRLPLPSFLGSAVSTLGDCMSPVAMLLTGMTIAKIDLKKALTNVSVYILSLIRLILIPLAAIAVLAFLPLDEGIKVCAVCAVAMPLGLNTIVVPAAYGKDTSVASGMAFISHLLSCITIPVIFMLFELIAL